MNWDKSPAGKEYNRKKAKEYYDKRKDDPEWKAKKRASQQKYYWSHRDELCEKQREKYEQKQLDESKFTVTKEEWRRRYGYEMGSTEGWQNWRGWDR